MLALGSKASSVNLHPLRSLVAHVSLVGASKRPGTLAALYAYLCPQTSGLAGPAIRAEGAPQPPVPLLLPRVTGEHPQAPPPLLIERTGQEIIAHTTDGELALPLIVTDPNPCWTEPLPLNLPPSMAFPKEQLESKYGLPLPLPPQLQEDINKFEAWSKATLQLDRGTTFAKPVQTITFQGHLESIRQYLGFLLLHFQLDPSLLVLSLYHDAMFFINFISFLKVSVVL